PVETLNQAGTAAPSWDATMIAVADGAAAGVKKGTSTIQLRQRETARLVAAAFSPDLKKVVTAGSDGTAPVWEAGSGRPLSTLPRADPAPVSPLAYSPDTSRIVTGDARGRVTLWDARTGLIIKQLAGHRDRILASAFSADGARVATSGNDHQVIV